MMQPEVLYTLGCALAEICGVQPFVDPPAVQ
jgi:hypothetical protein